MSRRCTARAVRRSSCTSTAAPATTSTCGSRRTGCCARGPCRRACPPPAQNRLAVPVPDHDLDHLDYTDADKDIADTGWWEEHSRNRPADRVHPARPARRAPLRADRHRPGLAAAPDHGTAPRSRPALTRRGARAPPSPRALELGSSRRTGRRLEGNRHAQDRVRGGLPDRLPARPPGCSLVAGCSGTVEASYRPPAPPAPSPTAAPAPAHPDPDADQLARAELRPDQVAVTVGDAADRGRPAGPCRC